MRNDKMYILCHVTRSKFVVFDTVKGNKKTNGIQNPSAEIRKTKTFKNKKKIEKIILNKNDPQMRRKTFPLSNFLYD